MTWDISYIANDGIQYISTAKNWLQGLGFSTDALIYAPHFQGELPAPQTVWPFGYSIAIALFSKIGLDLPQAAFAFNLIMHAAASLIMWLILRKLEIAKTFALVCTLLFYMLAMPWAYASGVMTEPLFATLLLAALLFLPDIKQGNLASWFLCGLIIAAAIYVRYSSVLFAMGTGVGIAICLLINERKSFNKLFVQACKLALLILIPVIAFSHLMYRTSTLIGTLDRYSGSKIPETLGSTAYLWFAKTSQLMGFNSSTLLPGSSSSIAFILLAALAIGVLLLFFLQKKSAAGSETSREYFHTLFAVASAHAVILAAYLTINSVSTSPLIVIERYIYQVYPGLFAVFCYALFHVTRNYNAKGKTTGRLVTAVSASMVLIYLFAQFNAAIYLRKHYFEEAWGAQQMMNLPVTQSQNLTEYTASCFSSSPNDSIWATHGQTIHLHTGIPTITQLDIYTTQPFDSSYLIQQIADYKLRMFFFVNSPDRRAETHIAYLDSMKAWLLQNGYVKVALQNNQFAGDRSLDLYTKEADCSL